MNEMNRKLNYRMFFLDHYIFVWFQLWLWNTNVCSDPQVLLSPCSQLSSSPLSWCWLVWPSLWSATCSDTRARTAPMRPGAQSLQRRRMQRCEATLPCRMPWMTARRNTSSEHVQCMFSFGFMSFYKICSSENDTAIGTLLHLYIYSLKSLQLIWNQFTNKISWNRGNNALVFLYFFKPITKWCPCKLVSEWTCFGGTFAHWEASTDSNRCVPPVW